MNKHKQTILICGNGMSGEILKELSEVYNVVLISEFNNDRGLEYVNYFIHANSKDPEEALKAAQNIKSKGYDFEAVLSLCWDSSKSVSKIAKHFNLSGISEEVAHNASNKASRSNLFREYNINSPKHAVVNSLDDLYKEISSFIFPIIIKPLELSSSKGVTVVEKREDLKKSYEYCKSFQNKDNQTVIINEYIIGKEYSLEGLIINGELHVTGISRRLFHYEKYYPNFVEIGDILPCGLSAIKENEARILVQKAARCLNIFNGVIKADLIINDEIFILELTPRLGGPRFGTEIIPLHNGTNILRAYINQLLGNEINIDDLKPKFSKGVVNKSVFFEPGTIKEIDINLKNLDLIEGFYDFKWWGLIPLQVGDVIEKPENGCGGIGYYIIQRPTLEEALKTSECIESIINIKTE